MFGEIISPRNLFGNLHIQLFILRSHNLLRYPVQTWNMCKGWLDPRTQAKIEIIGPGAESIKRLHELISPEYLPAEFAGTAPDLYYMKPNTEYLQLSRGSEVSK